MVEVIGKSGHIAVLCYGDTSAMSAKGKQKQATSDEESASLTRTFMSSFCVGWHQYTYLSADSQLSQHLNGKQGQFATHA